MAPTTERPDDAPALYRSKPIIVKAMRLTETSMFKIILWMREYKAEPGVSALGHLRLATKDGLLEAHIGDWIIHGADGEFRPCKPDLFEATYAPEEAKRLTSAAEQPDGNGPSLACGWVGTSFAPPETKETSETGTRPVEAAQWVLDASESDCSLPSASSIMVKARMLAHYVLAHHEKHT